MPKVKKNYKTEVTDGRMTIKMLEKGTDGKFHSASCEYPFVVKSVDADGKDQTLTYTRKQTENYLLRVMGYKA